MAFLQSVRTSFITRVASKPGCRPHTSISTLAAHSYSLCHHLLPGLTHTVRSVYHGDAKLDLKSRDIFTVCYTAADIILIQINSISEGAIYLALSV